MALKVPRAGGPSLFKDGYKHLQGIEEAVLRNIQAVNELSDIVRTSFGPNGRNKMVVNHLGRIFVTSDAATIIREMEVVHPAAKLLVFASPQQEEPRDGEHYGQGTHHQQRHRLDVLRRHQSDVGTDARTGDSCG